jgi:hypothetical protein
MVMRDHALNGRAPGPAVHPRKAMSKDTISSVVCATKVSPSHRPPDEMLQPQRLDIISYL